MKKITLSIGLLVGVLSSSAQSQCDSVTERNKLLKSDTLCTYFTIAIPYGDVLCLHLSDKKNRVRNVIATYFDGTTEKNILTSKDNVYYSQLGVVKVQVGTARTVLIDRY